MQLSLTKFMTAAWSFLLHGRRNAAWVRLPNRRIDGMPEPPGC